MKKYDIIVIGAGSGGLNVASFMNKAGFSVLLIDKKDRDIGGDCLNFGCVPSKALIHAAHIAHAAKQAKDFGLKVSGSVNLVKVAKYVDSKREYIRKHENAAHFRKRGIDVELGFATFNSKNSIIVNNKEYFGKKIIIATGARPRQLKVKGIEKIRYHTNLTIFELKKLPKKLLVIGGGPIGMEISQAFARLGSEVTVLIRGEHFLNKEDPEIVAVLKTQLEKEGVKLMFNTQVQEFTAKNKAKITTTTATKTKIKNKTKTGTLNFDSLFVSIGRELNIDKLNLKKAGIQLDQTKRKLKVDQYLRTTNKNVLACGDVAGSYQFTHAAEVHASVILNNFFSPKKKKLNYDNFAWVTFTDPEIATFGLNEQTLQKKKINYETFTHNFEHDDRAIVDNATYGKTKFFVGKKGKHKNKLLGGSMVAKNAGELIQELILANSAGLNIKAFFNKVYPYPTATRVNKYTLRPFFARKMTPFAKKVMHWLYH